MKTTAMILLISLISFSCRDTADRAETYDSKEAAIASACRKTDGHDPRDCEAVMGFPAPSKSLDRFTRP